MRPAPIVLALVTAHLGNWIPLTHLSLLFNRAITGTTPDPRHLDTLAASYAADGRFDDAVRTATSALELAEERGDAATAKQIRARLGLFRAHRAWVDPARD